MPVVQEKIKVMVAGGMPGEGRGFPSTPLTLSTSITDVCTKCQRPFTGEGREVSDLNCLCYTDIQSDCLVISDKFQYL